MGGKAEHVQERLVDELQELARSGDALRASSLDLPELRRLTIATFGKAGIDEVDDLIRLAAEELPSRERAAATILFTESPERWHQNLTERRSRAAEELGMGADTLRKKRGDTSPFDALTSALSQSIERVASAATDESVVPDEQVDASTRPPRGAGRSVLPWVGAVAGVAVIAGLVVATTGGDDAPAEGDVDVAVETTEPPVTTAAVSTPGVVLDGCDIPVGAAFGAVVPDAAVSSSIAAALAATDTASSLGCPTGELQLWYALWVQPLAGGDGAGWWVAAPVSGQPAVIMRDNLYAGYRRIADPDGSEAQATAGLPLSVDNDASHPRLDLAAGGMVIAENATAPARWMIDSAVEKWTALGGEDGDLGLPLTDANFVDGLPRQEFERGFGILTASSTIEATLLTSVEIEADVEALERSSEMILETFDRTSWWIDGEGERHWIPDGGVWGCLGGEAARVGDISPAWVVASFPLGDIAACG